MPSSRGDRAPGIGDPEGTFALPGIFQAVASGFTTLLAIALVGALASPLGGAIAAWTRPTTLFLSLTVGFAAGVLLGTFAFEMLPSAAEESSVPIAIGGFTLGFALVYCLDLYVHRGVSAGEKASQHDRIARRRRRRPARGDKVTVLAAGTSVEELIEGISIGVSAATDPRLGLIVGLAIAIDNVSEALSIGELAREQDTQHPKRRILFWTSLTGLSLFVSALAGWFLLRGLQPEVLGLLLGAGAGGMFYLTVSGLIPEAESHHVGQSGAIATAAGFLLIFALSNTG